MREELVVFSTAKLAKEKGFTLQTNPFGYVTKFYRPSTKTLLSYGRTGRSKLNTLIYAPTQSLLQRWLREVHNIIVEITWQMCSTGYECAVIDMNNPPEHNDDIERITSFKTYEEALEAGLYETLNLIK